MPFCPKCGKETPEERATCPSCGESTASAPPPTPEKVEFSAVEVLGSSFDIIRKKPIVLFPHIVPAAIIAPALFFREQALVFQSIESLLPAYTLFIGIMAIVIVGAIVSFIIEGMYPLMVKNVIEGKEVEMAVAFRKAVSRLPSVIGASILVGLLVGAGFMLAIVPGIIFITWYYYTIPAIMLENRGALDGISSSRRFGRTRKWKTFLMFLVLGLIESGGGIIAWTVMLYLVTSLAIPFFHIIPVTGLVIGIIIGIFASVWGSIIASYAYIKYAMPTQTTSTP